MDQNYDTVTVSKGGGILLKCSVAREALGCAFISPDGSNYNMLRDSAYEGGRIQQEELNSNDCAVKITDIQEFENGTWECSVTVKDVNENFDIGVGHIEVLRISEIMRCKSCIYLTTIGGRWYFW